MVKASALLHHIFVTRRLSVIQNQTILSKKNTTMHADLILLSIIIAKPTKPMSRKTIDYYRIILSNHYQVILS